MFRFAGFGVASCVYCVVLCALCMAGNLPARSRATSGPARPSKSGCAPFSRLSRPPCFHALMVRPSCLNGSVVYVCVFGGGGENAARNPVHHPVLRRSGRRCICSYGCIHARVMAVLFCRFACVAALPDVHEGSPTPAMQGVTTLVACLGTNDYSRMAPASLEAAAAPLHAVDVLLQCCDELTEGLNSAHREVCFVCVCVCACACVRVCVRVRVCVADSTRRCCFAPSM